MGCNVEARFSASARGSGSLVVRELRVFEGAALVAESRMAFLPA